jgi:hypothetical protein
MPPAFSAALGSTSVLALGLLPPVSCRRLSVPVSLFRPLGVESPQRLQKNHAKNTQKPPLVRFPHKAISGRENTFLAIRTFVRDVLGLLTG